MKKLLSNTPWYIHSLILGLVFFMAILLKKPIGVSTQYIIALGTLVNSLGFSILEFPYLAKYQNNIENPLNYGFIFVIFIFIGSLTLKLIKKERKSEKKASLKTLLLSFFSGIIVMYGARLAGGCTSGHMMSGMMQTSISGYVFAFAVFLTAIPVAIFIKKKGK